MVRANLPNETASKCVEEGQQTLITYVSSSGLSKKKKNISFAHGSNISDSQSSVHAQALSQPPPELSHLQRLKWLQEHRTTGLWVECEKCKRWRYISSVLDCHELPDKWYCKMNNDPNFAFCSAPEEKIHIHDEEDLIHSLYSAGSVVWARMPGWPWWPAMVDDCPDTEQFYWLDGFSDIPTYYNVVFFDSEEVTRAWIAPKNIKHYSTNQKILVSVLRNIKYRKRLLASLTQADDAVKLNLSERLSKYSFIARFKGTISSPTKVSKDDIEKYQKRLKRQFSVEFPVDDSFESEDSDSFDHSDPPNKRNSTLDGTPKKSYVKASKPKKIFKASKDKNSAKEADSAKGSNSLAVEIGSPEESELTNNSLDNDTSKTYAPDLDSANKPLSSSKSSQERTASPVSDDFEF